MILKLAQFLVPDLLLIYSDFTTQPSLKFTKSGMQKRKYPASSSSLVEKVLVMSEVRLLSADRKVKMS